MIEPEKNTIKDGPLEGPLKGFHKSCCWGFSVFRLINIGVYTGSVRVYEFLLGWLIRLGGLVGFGFIVQDLGC